ncbi:MAG: glycosyltransferase, partial [Ignavibacteriaceae bacterium]
STSDYYMYRQYQLEKINNVIYSPFGFNSSFYKKIETKKKYDVSFIGGYSPLRKWIINLLKKEGINVQVFGRGWRNEAAYISQEQIVEVFNQSKINLNISNAVYNDFKFLMWAAKSPKNIKQLLLLKKTKEQIKGRHYEINGCGGFQLSYFVPGLNLAYEIDKEIAVYEDVKFIPDSITFYLKDEELRNSIADGGYERSIREHSAQRYLKNLVTKITSKNNG